MIGAIASGAAVASIGHGLTMLLHHAGDPLLGMVAVFGTHAASLMVLLPLFVETPSFPPLAETRERATQWVLALGTTAIVFASTDVPPAVFVVMPMFAWLGFRGTLREATLLLTAVGALATTLTAVHMGAGARPRRALRPAAGAEHRLHAAVPARLRG